MPARPPVHHAAFDPAQPLPVGRPLAYVAMVQWISPMVWRSYGAEWNLLFHLHLAQRSRDDDYNDPVGSIPNSLLGPPGPVWEIVETIPAETIRPAEAQLIDNPLWFYTVWSKEKRPTWYNQNVYAAASDRLVGAPLDDRFWRRVGPHAFSRIPGDVPTPSAVAWVAEERRRTGDRMNLDYIERMVARAIFRIGEGSVPRFNPENHRPTVTADLGGRATGFTSLARALRYLEANPQRPVWVLSFDAPDFPAMRKQASENGVWLVLTHPDYNVHPYPRKPLAAIYAPQRVAIAEAPQRSRAQAHLQAMRGALGAAGVAPADVGMFFHDAGEGDAGLRALQPALHAVSTLGITEGVADRLYSVDKYIRNAGAAAATMNLAFATAWTHHRGKPVVVLGTREGEAVYAVTVGPPPGHVVPPRGEWSRARSVGRAYWPWWGAVVERGGGASGASGAGR